MIIKPSSTLAVLVVCPVKWEATFHNCNKRAFLRASCVWEDSQNKVTTSDILFGVYNILFGLVHDSTFGTQLTFPLYLLGQLFLFYFSFPFRTKTVVWEIIIETFKFWIYFKISPDKNNLSKLMGENTFVLYKL